MDNLHTILIIAIAAVITALLRILPFLIFGGDKPTPKFIQFLGSFLPYAMMGMLVVYCFKNVSVVASPHGIPELIACIVVAALHVWKRNSLLSVGAGTVCYMILVQFVF